MGRPRFELGGPTIAPTIFQRIVRRYFRVLDRGSRLLRGSGTLASVGIPRDLTNTAMLTAMIALRLIFIFEISCISFARARTDRRRVICRIVRRLIVFLIGNTD